MSLHEVVPNFSTRCLWKRKQIYKRFFFSKSMISFFQVWLPEKAVPSPMTCPTCERNLQSGWRLRGLPIGNSQRYRSGWSSWKFSNVTAGYWCCWSLLRSRSTQSEESIPCGKRETGDTFHNGREPETITSLRYPALLAVESWECCCLSQRHPYRLAAHKPPDTNTFATKTC